MRKSPILIWSLAALLEILAVTNGLAGPIRNQQSGLCLDADTNTIGRNGTKVQLWNCAGGKNQDWNWTQTVPAGRNQAAAGTLKNVASGRCLDADTGGNGGNGTKVQLWDCSGGINQEWSMFQDRYIRSNIPPTHAHGKYLTAEGTSNGTKIVIHTYYGGTNQHWKW